MEKYINVLDTMVRALGAIEVKGENNLNTLLGCIQLAKNLKRDLQTVTIAPKEETESTNC